MRRTLPQGVLIGGLLVAAPAGALAADDPATREAQARFEEGLTRVKAENFEAARVSFAQAYAVLHRPSILWNLALVEEKSGRVLEALAHFRDYVRQFPSEDDRAGAQKHFDALMAQTGHIEVQAPVGAQVTVDGGRTGIAPLAAAVDVKPGRHHVEARTAQGVKTSEADVSPGQIARVAFMAADPGGSTPLPASVAAAPTAASAPEPPGASTELQEPEARPADTRQPPHGAWSPRTITVVAVGGAALASAGLGVYFGQQSRSKADLRDSYLKSYGRSACATPAPSTTAACAAWNDALQAQNRDAILSYVFYVAGGALAVGAVATWFLWPGGPKPGAAAWLIPAVDGQGAGIAAQGRF